MIHSNLSISAPRMTLWEMNKCDILKLRNYLTLEYIFVIKNIIITRQIWEIYSQIEKAIELGIAHVSKTSMTRQRLAGAKSTLFVSPLLSLASLALSFRFSHGETRDTRRKHQVGGAVFMAAISARWPMPEPNRPSVRHFPLDVFGSRLIKRVWK